jgi:4'-phosphopantetheinyl transferase
MACWRVDLRQSDDVVGELTSILADDERARAARFVFAEHRRRFIVARGCLRLVLGRCCGLPPVAIEFAYSPHGKPSLPSAATPPVVHFNVSHSEDVALIALTTDLPVGVDVEMVRPVPDMDTIAARYFTAAEARAIAAVPAGERTLAFFLCWTRKEAFSKAVGEGLSLSLDRYRVTCTPDDPARIVEIDGSETEAALWSVFDLRPAAGCVGAAVTRGSPGLTLLDLDVEPELRVARRG